MNNATLATALLNNGRAVEQGFDVFGHLHIPETPLTGSFGDCSNGSSLTLT